MTSSCLTHLLSCLDRTLRLAGPSPLCKTKRLGEQVCIEDVTSKSIKGLVCTCLCLSCSALPCRDPRSPLPAHMARGSTRLWRLDVLARLPVHCFYFRCFDCPYRGLPLPRRSSRYFSSARLLLPALRLRTPDLVNSLSRLPVRMFVFSPASACDARASAFLAAGPSQRTKVSLVCT